MAMKQFQGNQVLALWILENQETTDFSMPARVLVAEALQYNRQLREIRKMNRRKYQQSRRKNAKCRRSFYKNDGEYLYRFRAQDRLFPVITLVAYWGEEEWEGPLTLHDMMDFGRNESLKKELIRLVPNYPLHFLNLSKLEDYSLFRTELRTLLELYALRADKQKFMDYLGEHDECRHLDEETCHILGTMVHSKALQALNSKEGKEDIDVCKAINDLIEDSRAEGIVEGKALGMTEGKAEGKAESLLLLLSDLGEASEQLKTRVLSEKDPAMLDRWLLVSRRAESLRQFIKMAEINIEGQD
ncbi:MAG: Rpn family recombination-promoting nuclease/putative transposase [Acetatifactor sp.]|nr:Rpn family recombination-promoting nuclease/putative transposase [Acetatifactor sp.]